MNNNIALLHSHYHFQTPIPNHHRTSLKCSSDNKHTVPARDRVIDFGKHKGKMLGTLPSSYLKWVSKTLRARHFEDWAKLADQVLQDPLYQDRFEWEFAQNALDGNRTSSSSSGVAHLLEISQRFGWDNEDKLGWSRVDFELLGTSKSGQIPRVDGGTSGGKGGGKRGGEVEDEREGGGSGSGRRRERRERVKLRMRKERREEKLDCGEG